FKLVLSDFLHYLYKVESLNPGHSINRLDLQVQHADGHCRGNALPAWQPARLPRSPKVHQLCRRWALYGEDFRLRNEVEEVKVIIKIHFKPRFSTFHQISSRANFPRARDRRPGPPLDLTGDTA